MQEAGTERLKRLRNLRDEQDGLNVMLQLLPMSVERQAEGLSGPQQKVKTSMEKPGPFSKQQQKKGKTASQLASKNEQQWQTALCQSGSLEQHG